MDGYKDYDDDLAEAYNSWYEESRYYDLMTYIDVAKHLIEGLRDDDNSDYIDEIIETIEQAENV